MPASNWAGDGENATGGTAPAPALAAGDRNLRPDTMRPISSATAVAEIGPTQPLSTPSATAAPSSSKAAAKSQAPQAKPRRRAPAKPKQPSVDAGQGDEQGEPDPADLALAQGVTPDAVLEVRRRKAAFRVMMRLLEEGADTQEGMVRLCAPLSGEEFMQVAEERSLAGVCGSPLCRTPVPMRRAMQDRWQAGAEEVVRETGALYCCAACGDLVRRYADMLGDPMQRLRPDARERLLVSHKPKGAGREEPAQQVAAQVNGVTTMLANIQERAGASVPAPMQTGTVEALQASSRAVEGYVPRTEQRRPQQQQQQQKPQTGVQQQGSLTLPPPPQPPPKPQSEGMSDVGTADSQVQQPVDRTATSHPMAAPDSVNAASPAADTASTVASAGPLSVSPGTAGASAHATITGSPHSQAPGTGAGLTPQHEVGGGLSTAKVAAGVARHIHMLVDDISAPIQPQHPTVGSPQIQESLPAQSSGHAASSAARDAPHQEAGGTNGTDVAKADSKTDATASVTSAAADGVNAGRPLTPQSILKKPRRWGRIPGKVKKQVRWADEQGLALTEEQQATTPETPMFVFTVEGEGETMEGGIMRVPAAPGEQQEEEDSDPEAQPGPGGKRLAGRLEAEDVGKLHTVTEHALELASMAPAHPPPRPQLLSQQQQEAGREEGAGKLPKSLQMWFPVSAGGTGVALPPPVRQGTARKFKPRTPPARMPAVAAIQPSSAPSLASSHGRPIAVPTAHNPILSQRMTNSQHRSMAATSSRPPALSGSRQPTAVSGSRQPAPVLAGGVGQGGSALPGSRPSPAPTRVIGRASGSCKVVMLDAPPGRKLAANPVAARLTQSRLHLPAQATSGAATGARPGLAGAPPHTDPRLGLNPPALERVIPTPEALPFEEPGSSNAHSRTPSRVMVIKSDPQHAALLGRQGAHHVPVAPNTGERDAGDSDTDSSQSDSDQYQPEASGPTHFTKGAAQQARSNMGQGGEEDDEEVPAGTSSEEPSDSDSEGSEGGQGAGQARRGRRVRGDVIYEEDDEGMEADAAGPVTDTVQAARGGEEEEEEGEEGAEEWAGREGSEEDDEAYQSAAPFFGPPPAEYRVELSPFNALWSLVSSWVTRETLQYMNAPAGGMTADRPAKLAAAAAARDAAAAHTAAMEAVGGEVGRDADSTAAEAVLTELPTPSMQSAQARVALAELLFPHLADALQGMKGRVSLGEVTKRASGMLRTFVFPGPLPALSPGQWRLLSLAVLRALSMARLPGLSDAFERQEGPKLLAAMLEGTGFELPHLSALLDLLLNA